MNNNGPFEWPYTPDSAAASAAAGCHATDDGRSDACLSLGRHRLALIEPFSARRSTDINEIRADRRTDSRVGRRAVVTNTWHSWLRQTV